MRTHKTLATLALLAVPVLARTAGAVTIAELVAHKDAYNGQTVTVTGTVEIAVPAAAESAYQLQDGPAKITVLSRSGPPAAGASLTVTGKMAVFHEGDGGPEETDFPPWIFEVSRTPGP